MLKRTLGEYFGIEEKLIKNINYVGVNIYHIDGPTEVIHFNQEKELKSFLETLNILKIENQGKNLEMKVNLSQQFNGDRKVFIDIKTNSTPLAYELMRNFSVLNKFLELYKHDS